MLFGFIIKKKRAIVPLQHNINAYDNPIYDGEPDMENTAPEQSLYTDVPANDFNEDGYMDVSTNIESNVSTFYNEGMDSPEIISSNIESDL